MMWIAVLALNKTCCNARIQHNWHTSSALLLGKQLGVWKSVSCSVESTVSDDYHSFMSGVTWFCLSLSLCPPLTHKDTVWVVLFTHTALSIVLHAEFRWEKLNTSVFSNILYTYIHLVRHLLDSESRLLRFVGVTFCVSLIMSIDVIIGLFF